MFTGIIQQVGRLAARSRAGGSVRLAIEAKPWTPALAHGESISVSGVCLTVAAITSRGFACDVLDETLRVTSLGAKKAGALLNLERAVRADGLLGGHIITGHVEGVGILRRRTAENRDWRLEIGCGKPLLARTIERGSIACDGVSLTVAALSADSFAVNIIPFTWANTTLNRLRPGDKINLETDLFGKYVFRWLEQQRPGKLLTEEFIRGAFGGGA